MTAEETAKKIRIALIDDHTLFRSGLKALLSRQSDFEIVGEAADGLEGVKLVEQIKPDIVLLDLDMPTMSGNEALAQILEIDPSMKVLMLTVSEDGDDLAECMRLGAVGYLLKKIDADFLLQSIRHAVAGDSVISPEMTSKLVMKLYQKYKKLGIENVSIKLYPDARHEILNETNKAEVWADFLAKIEEFVAAAK